jgi:hypothetical protein
MTTLYGCGQPEKRSDAALRSGRPTASLRATPPPRLLHHVLGRGLDLTRTSVVSLDDRHASWPIQPNLWDASVHLSGFQYTHLQNPSGSDASNGARHGETRKMRKHWLELQGKRDVVDPQPWLQLAAVLDKQGYKHDSELIRIYGLRKLRDGGSLGSWQRFISHALDWLSGYGYRPWLTLFAWILPILVSSVLFWTLIWGYCNTEACGNSRPIISVYSVEKSENRPVNTASGGQARFPVMLGSHEFSPILYAVDLFLPVPMFGQKSQWMINTNFAPEKPVYVFPDWVCSHVSLQNGAAAPVVERCYISFPNINYLRAFLVFEIVAGLILIPLFFVGLAGLIR